MNLETVADRRLHPATFAIRGIRGLPQYVIGLPAVFSVISHSSLWSVLLLGLAGAVAALGGAWLYWRRFRYGVGARDIVIESGIFQRQRRVIPFDRIQDIDIEQGLLARLFGTAKVKIETGAAAKNEGDLDSVSLADAQWLRAMLRGDRGAVSGSVSQDAGTELEPLLFRMDMPRLLLAGLFNFSLFYIAFIFGAFQYVELLFGFDPLDLDWIEPTRDMLVATGAAWLLSMLAAAGLVLVGVIAGILRTIARDYDFRLSRAAMGLRRQRGLFTLSEVMIPYWRVQLAVVRSGLIGRAFGWFKLEFQTLNADAAKSGHQMAVPLGRMDEILAILSEVHAPPLPDEEDYIRVSKRHILRQSLQWMLVLVLPIIAAAIAWPAALALLVLLPFAVGAAALQWKHHRYHLDGATLHVRQGIMDRRLWIVPCERIQTIGVTQGPLQRRLGLATLHVDTAGALALRGPHIVNLPEARAKSLAEQLLAVHKHAREAIRSGRSQI